MAPEINIITETYCAVRRTFDGKYYHGGANPNTNWRDDDLSAVSRAVHYHERNSRYLENVAGHEPSRKSISISNRKLTRDELKFVTVTATFKLSAVRS